MEGGSFLKSENRRENQLGSCYFPAPPLILGIIKHLNIGLFSISRTLGLMIFWILDQFAPWYGVLVRENRTKENLFWIKDQETNATRNSLFLEKQKNPKKQIRETIFLLHIID